MNSRSRNYRKNHKAIPKHKKHTPPPQEIGSEAPNHHLPEGRNHTYSKIPNSEKKPANRKLYSTDYHAHFQEPKSAEPTTKGRRKRRRKKKRQKKQLQRRRTWEKLCLRIHTVYVPHHIYEVRICAYVWYDTYIYVHIWKPSNNRPDACQVFVAALPWNRRFFDSEIFLKFNISY
jgi:hypothetical protein